MIEITAKKLLETDLPNEASDSYRLKVEIEDTEPLGTAVSGNER